MVTLVEAVLLTIAAVAMFVYVCLVWNLNFWKKRGIKGPRPALLVGNMKSLLNFSNHICYDMDQIYRQYKGKERFIGYFLANQPRLLILDPKLIRDILISNFRNFHNNGLIFPIDPKVDKMIAQNPFFLRGAEWKEKRAEITPALSNSRIKASYPIMKEVCKKLTKFVENEFENPPPDGIEAKELAARYTIEVVSSAIFGIDAGAFSKGECRIRKEAMEINPSDSGVKIFLSILASSFPVISKFLFKYQIISKNKETFFTNLMRDAIKLREQTKDNRVDFLNYLLTLREKKNLSEFYMASHTLVFFIDGFETSSVLVSHVIHMLAKHKAVQEKLRDELKEALTEDGIPFEKLIELPYLDCVVNETLRLFPPASFITKLCTEPTEFTNSEGKQIPIEKDITIDLPIYSIHRDPEYYENADKFLPERFNEENGGVKKYRDMNVFFPFGDGPRMCLGMRFGLAQSKAAIAELVLTFDMTLNKKTKPECRADPKNILFVTNGGVWVNYKRLLEPKKTV